MPLYVYRCPNGHESEVLERQFQPSGSASIECVQCPEPSRMMRAEFNHVATVGIARTPLGQREVKIGAFQEASAELEHQHSRQTNVDGSPTPTPSLWKAARAKARRLQKLGVKDSLDVRHD